MKSNPEIETYMQSFNHSAVIGSVHPCSGVLGFYCSGGQGVLNWVDDVNMIVPDASNTLHQHTTYNG